MFKTIGWLSLLLSAVAALPHQDAAVRDLSGHLQVRAAASTTYTALVAFGASYTDNAHARAASYASSLRDYVPYSNYGGRYTNGPVAVEYMVAKGVSPALAQATGVRPVLVDYAYGGSQIDNNLTYGASPASKDQVLQYLSDLQAGTAGVGAGRVLHFINSGINPVTVIWTDALAANSTAAATATAKSRISANVNAIASQMRSINTNAAVSKSVHGADFLIVGIPPLEIIPSFTYQASNNATKLSLLKSLSAQFNSELQTFAKALKSESRNGKVMFYDLASLWYQVAAGPSRFGVNVSPYTKTCYNSATGAVCTNPSDFLYFDSLHPTTSFMRLLATKLNALVKNTSS